MLFLKDKLRKELESLEEMRKVYKQTSVEISVERLKNQKMRDTWERMTSKGDLNLLGFF